MDIWTDGYTVGFKDGLHWALKFRSNPKLINEKIKELEEQDGEQ